MSQSNPAAPVLGLPRLNMPGPVDAASLLAFRTPLREQNASADGKAAALLTLLGIMFTMLAKFAPQLGGLLGCCVAVRWSVLGLLAVFVVLAMGTVLQAFRTLSPRFPPSPPSLAFFGDIARMQRQDYVQQVQAMTPAQALEQILNYNYTVSSIVVIKFAQLSRGLKLFRAAFVAWMLLMLVLVGRAVL
jgi:hypothetical protein